MTARSLTTGPDSAASTTAICSSRTTRAAPTPPSSARRSFAGSARCACASPAPTSATITHGTARRTTGSPSISRRLRNGAPRWGSAASTSRCRPAGGVRWTSTETERASPRSGSVRTTGTRWCAVTPSGSATPSVSWSSGAASPTSVTLCCSPSRAIPPASCPRARSSGSAGWTAPGRSTGSSPRTASAAW